jgi:hypothetical protein
MLISCAWRSGRVQAGGVLYGDEAQIGCRRLGRTGTGARDSGCLGDTRQNGFRQGVVKEAKA